MSRRFAHFLLESAEPEPLVVLAHASEGTWVAELLPASPPVEPVRFWVVRGGQFGPILHTSGLILLRLDLRYVLTEFCVVPYVAYSAILGPPQSQETRDDYAVIKVPSTTPIAALCSPPPNPIQLSVVSESPNSLLVSADLRAQLEAHGIPDLRFAEPHFAASASAG